MEIVELDKRCDIEAAISSQSRTYSQYPRIIKMSLAEKAAAKAAKLRAGKKSPAAAATKSASKKGATRKGRASRATDADKTKVVSMYKAGKTSKEISDSMGWTEKGNWPYQYTLGVIRQLRKANRIGYRAKK